LFRFFNI